MPALKHHFNTQIYVVVKPSEVVLAGYEYCYHATISGIYGCGFQAQHDACRRQFVISSYLNGTIKLLIGRMEGLFFFLVSPLEHLIGKVDKSYASTSRKKEH